MDCIVHGVAKSRTQVNNFHSHSLIVLFQLRAFCPLLKSGSPAICFNTFLNIIPRYGICCPQISEVSPVTTSLDNFRFNWRFQIHETETGHIQHQISQIYLKPHNRKLSMPASRAMTIWESLQIPRSYLLSLITGSSMWRMKPWRGGGVHTDLEILSSTQESISLLTVFQVQFPIYQKRKISSHQAEKNTKPWLCPDFYQFVF